MTNSNRLTAEQAAQISIPAHATDGEAVLIRATRPQDAETILDLYPEISTRSLYMRFLRVIDKPTLKQVQRYTNVDFDIHLGLVVLYGPEQKLCGAGRIIRTKPEESIGELSCMMIDKMQRKGLGRLLVATLIDQARAWGITEVVALVHPQNGPMLRLFKSLGYPCQIVWEEGDYMVSIDNRLPPDFELNPPYQKTPASA
ncbi:GNAT family N-acetyltransferase [Ferrimonas lipolytica]|uniref:GNAT family N-acetyltransferase n=1 Tax=Ferrimonas lipolytica TaxID=2724191 RepID=A0A6H1UBC8_9GAMM|nr:GNAT family N-acetyltransferase [Ferrimonas lipolytica]QIZ76387.1 GNAT family N-acetyltransferase [Ferrimonas lipolytica]